MSISKQHTLYKLTDQDGYTRRGEHNETLWLPGYIYSAVGNPDQSLCSSGWIHAYTNPLIAVVMNPRHAEIKNPRLWKAIGTGAIRYDGEQKCGVRHLQITKELPLPEISTPALIHFAILYGIETTDKRYDNWHIWANNWLNGTDRTKESAATYAAATATYAAAYAAATATYAAATYAAAAAATATYAAATAATYAAAPLLKLLRKAIAAEAKFAARK